MSEHIIDIEKYKKKDVEILFEIFSEYFPENESKRYAVILDDKELREKIGIPSVKISVGSFIEYYAKWYNKKSKEEKELIDSVLSNKINAAFAPENKIVQNLIENKTEQKKETLFSQNFLVPDDHGLKEHVVQSLCLFVDDLINEMKTYFNSVQFKTNDEFGEIIAVSKNDLSVKISLKNVYYNDFGYTESNIELFVHSPEEKNGNLNFWGLAETLDFNSARSKRSEDNWSENTKICNQNMKNFIKDIAEKYENSNPLENKTNDFDETLKNNGFIFPELSWSGKHNNAVKQSKNCSELGWIITEGQYPHYGYDIFACNKKTGDKSSEVIFSAENKFSKMRFVAEYEYNKESEKILGETIKKIDEIEKLIENEIHRFSVDGQKINIYLAENPDYLSDMEQEMIAYGGGDIPSFLILEKEENQKLKKRILFLSNFAYENSYDTCVIDVNDEDDSDDYRC